MYLPNTTQGVYSSAPAAAPRFDGRPGTEPLQAADLDVEWANAEPSPPAAQDVPNLPTPRDLDKSIPHTTGVAGDPDLDALERWGFNNGFGVSAVMRLDDGYWTPWHIAAARLESRREDVEIADGTCRMVMQQRNIAESERDTLAARAKVLEELCERALKLVMRENTEPLAIRHELGAKP